MSSSDQQSSTPGHKANSSQISISSSPAHSMDDINMLLYLDALQRSMDNQNFLSQKVEDAYKNYQKQYSKYAKLYAKLVSLVKKASTRKVLKQNKLVELDFDQAEKDIQCITESLHDDIVTAYMNLSDLERFKKELNRENRPDNLKDIRDELMRLKSYTESIQLSLEAIEAGLDSGIIQSLDLCAEELHMTNFPRLCRKNETSPN